MSVSETNTIDVVWHDPSDDTVVLSMIEKRSWGPSGELVPDLQEKIKAYLAYALDGQLKRDHPKMGGKRIKFRLEYSFIPGAQEEEFLSQVKQYWLAPEGITWEQQILT